MTTVEQREEMGRELLWMAVVTHPLPWRVEDDWTHEVIASDGACIAKCMTPEAAQFIVDEAEAVAKRMALGLPDEPVPTDRVPCAGWARHGMGEWTALDITQEIRAFAAFEPDDGQHAWEVTAYQEDDNERVNNVILDAGGVAPTLVAAQLAAEDAAVLILRAGLAALGRTTP